MQQTRYLKEMEKVVFDKDFAKKNPDLELYYMSRGVKRENVIRYDITEIPPQMLGQEFVKTKGHYHLEGQPELYVVLEGAAIYLMQKTEGEQVKDVYAIEAKKGDFVIIPSGYGHITINPSEKELKMANWVSEKCQNVYHFFEKMQGACYYYTKGGWIKNKNYKEVPVLRFEKPLKEKPQNLDFLKNTGWTRADFSGRGEIGTRAWFRIMWLKDLVGSTPTVRTICGFLYFEIKK